MRILIIKLSALGDIVHSLPALNLLKKYRAAAKIDFLVDERFAGILEGQKSINEIITCSKKNFFEQIKPLQAKKYDLVIDMQGLIKTAFLSWTLGPNIGFKEPREWLAAVFYRTKVDCGHWLDAQKHVVEKNIELISYLIKEKDFHGDIAQELDYGSLGKISLRECLETHPHKNLKEVCLIPCTTWESKHWPQEQWIKLASQLKQKYDCRIHILGTKKDENYLSSMASRLSELSTNSDDINLHLEIPLNGLSNFFSSMDLIVGVDTGPIHIAAASVNPKLTEIIGIYGPSSAARSGPFGFSAVSSEELFGHRPRNKRKLSEDESISWIKAAHIIDKIEESYTGL